MIIFIGNVKYIAFIFLGTADQKTRLMFDMYDVDRSGRLTVEELKTMFR